MANRRQITLEVTKVNPLGYVSMFWYDANGNLVAERINANGNIMTQTATVDAGAYFLEVRAAPGVSAYTFVVRGQ